MDEYLQDRYKNLVEKMVKEGSLPRALFKYRSLSSINTYKIFVNKKLYFSTPKDFNDPFDCKIDALISNTDVFVQSLAKYGSNEGVMPAIENGHNINNTIGKVVNRKGICCFSKEKDNILMWSHYADSHRGICLEFEISENDNFFSCPIREIKYDESYHVIDVSRTRNDIGEKLFIKHECWQYEKEVRIYKEAPGEYGFNPTSLKAIYFGCKVEDSERKNLYEFIRGIECFGHVEFYKGKVSESEYKIDFDLFRV